MGAPGQRIYDEDSEPISSTDHEDGKKRAIDVTAFDPENTSPHNLTVEELLALNLLQLKIITRHFELLNDSEIKEKDLC